MLVVVGCSQLRWSGDEPEADTNTSTETQTGPTNRQRAVSSRTRPAKETSIITDPGLAEQRLATAGRNEAALTSAQVGYFMDVHEARLRQALAGTPVKLRRDSEGFVLTIPGTATFTSGSTMLMNDIRPALESIARVLAEFDKTQVTVLGHTDDRGDADFNRRLSERRALAVANYLREHGIAVRRLAAIGMGETRPVSDNATSRHRALNRRVEITVQPLVKAPAGN